MNRLVCSCLYVALIPEQGANSQSSVHHISCSEVPCFHEMSSWQSPLNINRTPVRDVKTPIGCSVIKDDLVNMGVIRQQVILF